MGKGLPLVSWGGGNYLRELENEMKVDPAKLKAVSFTRATELF
jgi:hypothetical protein